MEDANRMALVRTTVALEEDARRLARRLVTKKLAACVHVQRIQSTYVWDDEVKEEGEWLVEARAPGEVAQACWLAMKDKHPYDVPLVELLDGVRDHGSYARWARRVTGLE